MIKGSKQLNTNIRWVKLNNSIINKNNFSYQTIGGLKSGQIFSSFRGNVEIYDGNHKPIEEDNRLNVFNVGLHPLLEQIISSKNKSLTKNKLDKQTLFNLVEKVEKLNLETNESKKRELKKQIMTISKGDSNTLYQYSILLLTLFKMTGSRSGANSIFKLLEISREFGSNSAAYTFSSLLYEGLGEIKKDHSKSKSIMKSLCDNNAPLAMVKYGVWLIQDNQVQEGLQYLEKAANAKVELAYNQLGHIYRKGQGVEKDLDKAIKYYNMGAELNNAESHFYLGIIKDSLESNSKHSFKHFELAASKGLPEAQFNLGLKYLFGNVVQKDLFLCKEYWLMASQQKFPLAMLNLAKLLMNDNEVKDKLMAKQLLKEVVTLFSNSKFELEAKFILNNFENPDKKLIEIKEQNNNINKGKSNCLIM